jgi:hypothetical protein
MKILLQNLETLEYSSCEADWTPDPDQALDFFEVTRALDYAMSHGCEDVRVVMKFEEPRDNLELPPLHLAAGRASHRPP